MHTTFQTFAAFLKKYIKYENVRRKNFYKAPNSGRKTFRTKNWKFFVVNVYISVLMSTVYWSKLVYWLHDILYFKTLKEILSSFICKYPWIFISVELLSFDIWLVITFIWQFLSALMVDLLYIVIENIPCNALWGQNSLFNGSINPWDDDLYKKLHIFIIGAYRFLTL